MKALHDKETIEWGIFTLITDKKLVFVVLGHMLHQITFRVGGIITLVARVVLIFNGYFQMFPVDMLPQISFPDTCK